MTPAEIIARELCHTRPKVEQRPGNYEMVVSTDFSPVVAAILNALQAAGIRLEYDDPVRTIYGSLHRRHADALRKGDEPRRAKIFEAIETLRSEYPEKCQVWDDRYSDDPAIRSLAGEKT